jgi:hypothetical protein
MITYAVLIVALCFGPLQAAVVSGVVTDSATGAKLGAVIVQLRSGAATLAADTTDAQGAYSFTAVDTGKYAVKASKTDYTAKSVSKTIKPGGADVTVNIALSAIVKSTIAGTVKDSASAAPLSGVIVHLFSGGQIIDRDTTGADGAFSFEKVKIGSYTVRAMAAGYVSPSIDASVKNQSPVAISIRLVKVVTATIGGTVKDSATGTALSGALVQLRLGSRIIALDTCGSDGAFSFAQVDAGVLSIKVSMPGYRTTSADVSFSTSDGILISVALVASAYGVVMGTITGDSLSGQGLDAVTILLTKDGMAIDTAVSTTRGIYFFDKVEIAVSYALVASKAGFAAKSMDIGEKKNGADTINFFMKAFTKKKIRVSVLAAADSSVIAAATVALLTSGGSTMITGKTDTTGTALFADVEEGTYAVSASAAGFTAASKQYTFNAAPLDSIKIFLVKAIGGTKTVSGIVVDSISGKPLANVMISINDGAGGIPLTIAATSAENGAYTIAGILKTTAAITLTATLTGYKTIARSVVIGKDSLADTTKFDVKMITTPVKVTRPQSEAAEVKRVRVTVSPQGLIALSNISGTGVVRLFGLNGALLYQCHFNSAHSSTVTLGRPVNPPKTAIIVRVSQSSGSTVTCKEMPLPR